MTVMLAPTSVCKTRLDRHDVVLLLQFILRDTVRGSVSLTAMLQQQPHFQMPSQAYANYAMGPSQVSFSFRAELPTISLCHMLMSVMVFAFYFLIWLPWSLKGTQLLKFTTPQTFKGYPWQACVPPGDCLWPMPGVH